jgi:hypothetical protein
MPLSIPGVGRFFGQFFGRTVGDAASFAIGGSVERTIDPLLQELTNETWSTAVASGVTKPLDAGTAAAIVAEDVAQLAWGEGQAAEQGIGSDQFTKLLGETLSAPGIGELYQLWRRDAITDTQFVHGLRKAKLETLWDGPLETLKTARLDPAVIASAIQRGIMTDPGFLPVGPPSGGGTVPSFPVSPIDPLAEAKAAGIDSDRLFVETALVGNSMGPQEAAHAQFRGIIDDTDYARAIAEGRTRNEWAGPLREVARQIPTTTEFVENAIRGYSTLDDAIAGGARHGMSAADVTLIYQNAGRPLVPHQITTGLARGAAFHPIPGEITDPYEAAAHEASVKPSYQELYIAAGKYSYPSLFQLNALVKANAITAATAEDWATKSGLAPEVITALGTFWAGEQGGSTTTGTKPKTYTYSQIHQAWSHLVFTDAQAITELESIGYPAARAQTLLTTWKAQQTASS